MPCSPANFIRTLFEETGPTEHVREILDTPAVHAPRSFESEEHLYLAGRMAFLPPELRDDPASIASARAGHYSGAARG